MEAEYKKKEEKYQVLRPDELPSSADIDGSVGSSSVCIAYTYVLRSTHMVRDSTASTTFAENSLHV